MKSIPTFIAGLILAEVVMVGLFGFNAGSLFVGFVITIGAAIGMADWPWDWDGKAKGKGGE